MGRFIGDPGVIRTRDPQIRNLVLYPTELRDRFFGFARWSGVSGKSCCVAALEWCQLLWQWSFCRVLTIEPCTPSLRNFRYVDLLGCCHLLQRLEWHNGH